MESLSEVTKSEIYRKTLAEALLLSRRYLGVEEDYNALMAVLLRLERWIAGNIDGEDSEAREITAAFLHAPAKPKTLNDVLTIASGYKRRLESALEKGKQPFLRIKIDGIILPPGDGEILKGDTSESFKEPKFQERLYALLIILQGGGVFSDDIAIVDGKKPDDSMIRKASYVIIEIPRLDRSVLVCDQLGEATFVTKGIFNRSTLCLLTKANLQERFPAAVQRIVFSSSWGEDLKELLFKEWEEPKELNKVKGKIDLPAFEELRSALQRLYPTSKDWCDLAYVDKEKIKFKELKVAGIASRLGVAAPLTSKGWLEMGLRIYGEDDEWIRNLMEVESRDKEQWRAAIRKKTPDFKLFMKLEYQEIEVDGYHIIALGTTFGLDITVPTVSAQLNLGKIIYELSDEDDEFRSVFPPEGWLSIAALAGERGTAYDTVAKRLRAIKDSYPGDHGLYLNLSSGKKYLEFFSPRLINEALSDLKESPEEKWLSLNDLSVAIQTELEAKDLLRGTSLPSVVRAVKEAVKGYTDHVKSFKGKTRPSIDHYRQALIPILTKFFSRRKIAPRGWISASKLSDELGVHDKTIAQTSTSFNPQKEDAEEFYITIFKPQKGRYFSPQFADQIRRHVRANLTEIPSVKDGYLTKRAISTAFHSTDDLVTWALRELGLESTAEKMRSRGRGKGVNPHWPPDVVTRVGVKLKERLE